MFERYLGLVATGLAIKLMDDFLDRQLDNMKDIWNSYVLLENSILPYSLLLLTIGLILNTRESSSLFMASYIIGMGYVYKSVLPSKLKIWQESLIVLIIGLYLLGFKEITSSILLIIFIQILDDFLDYNIDYKYKGNNLVYRFGVINTLFIEIFLLIISILFYPVKIKIFLLAAGTVYFFVKLLKLYYNRSNINNKERDIS